MSNVTTAEEKTPAAAAQPEPETKPKKPAKGAKPAAKKAKPAKKAKAPKKAKPAAKNGARGRAQQQEGRGHRDDEAGEGRDTGRDHGTDRPGRSTRSGASYRILGKKGGQKIESSKNAAGERTYRITK